MRKKRSEAFVDFSVAFLIFNIYIYIYLSVCLSVCLSIYLSIRPSVTILKLFNNALSNSGFAAGIYMLKVDNKTLEQDVNYVQS